MNDFIAFMFMVIAISAILFLVGWIVGCVFHPLLVILVACLLTALANMTGG